MRLSPTAFNRHLNQIGQAFSWQRGYACPCVNRNSGQAKTNCKQCSGKGRMWGEAVEGSAGVISQSRLKAYEAFGPWDTDDMLLSIPSDSPLYEIGQYDRMHACNRTEPFSVNMVRGLNDTMRFEVVDLERCFYLNANEDPVELPLPGISETGALVWASGGPPAQTTFSLTGRRRPEYFVYLDLPTDRPIHFGQRLPRKVVVRRFDLFGR